MHKDIYHELLYRYWGYTSFRPLQEEIIDSVVAGKDTLGLMPTGGGKSITFQVPALVLDGLCLVVTPLIALMKDQVDNLKARGIKALAVYTGMTYQEILTTLDNAVLGDYKFLYISPERLSSDLFQKKLQNMHLSFLVVDESHCISQWGYDFRPSYLNIVKVRTLFPDIPVMALTATATHEVVNDIQDKLSFRKKNVFRTSYERRNLIYSVSHADDKLFSVVDYLKKTTGSTIIYVRSRKKTREIATELVNQGFSADFYHAGLNNEEKNRKQAAWKENRSRIIVATNAFGMGIDKPDVRLVLHTDLPNSLEEYFQEAGRAGRDGEKAWAVILCNKRDTAKLKKRISDEFPEKSFILKVYEQLAYFLQIAEGYGVGRIFDFNLNVFCSSYKLPVLPTHNALKILDLAGYIEYTDEVENRSRIMFRIYRDELYRYNFDSRYEQLISTILRLYTGLFSDYAYISEDLLASRLKVKRNEVYDMLKNLSGRNIIDYIPQKKTPFIVYKQPRQDIKYISLPKYVFEERKERFLQRIGGMLDYVESDDRCRSRTLLSYFGEKEAKDCGQCDVCLSASGQILSSERFDYIFSLIQEALRKEPLSVGRLSEMLQQTDKKELMKVIRFQLDKGILCLDDNNKIKLAE